MSDQDCLGICVPNKISCSILGKPIFWLAFIYTIIVGIISTNNIVDVVESNGSEQAKMINPVALRWVWGIILGFLFLFPTIIAIGDNLKSTLHKPGEHPSSSYARCIMYGYIIILTLILAQSYTLKLDMFGWFLTISIAIVIILLWMIWLTHMLKSGRIYATIAYVLLIVWYMIITYVNYQFTYGEWK